jgi:hypothetical protein
MNGTSKYLESSITDKVDRVLDKMTSFQKENVNLRKQLCSAHKKCAAWSLALVILTSITLGLSGYIVYLLFRIERMERLWNL